jgi:hypothetical protein
LWWALTNIAHLSPVIELRRAAAKAVANLEPQTQTNKIRQEFKGIRDKYSNDITHSVRFAANKQ